eukprot:c24786_g1_i1 orf=184-1485(+)
MSAMGYEHRQQDTESAVHEEEEEEDEEVAVPQSFICPISLDVMEDPVTVSTGHTYNRESIQKWFNEGHSNCPLTMQHLQDKILIPNHMLHAIMHNWFSNRIKTWRSSSDLLVMPVKELPPILQATILLSELRKEGLSVKVGVLEKFRSLAQENANIRTSIIDAGAVPLLTSLLVATADGREEQFFASIGTLAVLPLSQEVKRQIGRSKVLQILCSAVSCVNPNTSLYSLEMLVSLAELDEMKILISHKSGTILSLLHLVEDTSFSKLAKESLHLIQSLTSLRSNRHIIIREGAVRVLTDLLSQTKHTKQAEDILTVLETLSHLAEGRAAMVQHPIAIPSIVKMIHRVSERCTKMTISILWTVCKADPEGGGMMAIRGGAMVQVLLVLQCEWSSRVKWKAMEVLKIMQGQVGHCSYNRIMVSSFQEKVPSTIVV